MNDKNFYFRIKGQNAAIFRIVKDSRKSRELFEHIGNLVFNNGRIKLQNDEILTHEEEIEIETWLENYQAREKEISRARAFEMLTELNHMAQWVQSDASDEDIAEIFDTLIMSVLDLRQTAIRRYAKAIEKYADTDSD